MRLVCPNCEAKYEVPDDAIPDTGRDVQCANCGHAWFQMRARPATATVEEQPAAGVAAAEAAPAPAVAPAAVAEAAPAEPVVVIDPEATIVPVAKPKAPPPVAEVGEVAKAATPAPAPEPDPAPEPEAAPAPEAAVTAPSADTPAEADNDAALAAAVAEAAAAEKAPAAYAVDESVLAILREEAEREANARRAEARGSVETQTDLGIETAPPIAAAAALGADSKTLARRGPFPDVEEINSSLRPEEFPVEELDDVQPAETRAERRSGFRSGFLTVMTLAILAAALYVVAPRLSAMVPALEGPLVAYVSAVDGLRLQLDGMMRSATLAINGN